MRSVRLAVSSKIGFTALLLTYAIVLTPFLDASLRNYLVLGAIPLGMLSIVSFRLTVTGDFLAASVLFFHMLVVALISKSSNDLGSMALTTMFAMGYIVIAGFTKKPWFGNSYMLRLFGFIIQAFAVVSVLQMLTSLSNFPVPNLIASKGLWSYNSLANEPSQLGRVVGITMLAYLLIARMDRPKATLIEIIIVHRTVVLAFLLTMLLSGSSLAALAIILVFILANSMHWILVTGFALLLVWPLAMQIEYEPLRRSVLLISSLSSLDVETVFRAEGSGAIRVIPFLIYLEAMNPDDLRWWFGSGSQGLTEYFLGQIPSAREIASAGFIPGFAVFYGVIGMALLLWAFVLRFANWTTAPIILLWLALFSSVAWNIQIFWYGLVVLRIVYALDRRRSRPHPEGAS